MIYIIHIKDPGTFETNEIHSVYTDLEKAKEKAEKLAEAERTRYDYENGEYYLRSYDVIGMATDGSTSRQHIATFKKEFETAKCDFCKEEIKVFYLNKGEVMGKKYTLCGECKKEFSLGIRNLGKEC